MGTTTKSQAEGAHKFLISEFDDFDEEQPMSRVARDIFPKQLVPLLKKMFEERLERGDYDGVGDLCWLWSTFSDFTGCNGPTRVECGHLASALSSATESAKLAAIVPAPERDMPYSWGSNEEAAANGGDGHGPTLAVRMARCRRTG
jgi:hypothetical protein